MITAILLGLPALIVFMLSMDDPASKARERSTSATATVIAFPLSSTPSGTVATERHDATVNLEEIA